MRALADDVLSCSAHGPMSSFTSAATQECARGRRVFLSRLAFAAPALLPLLPLKR